MTLPSVSLLPALPGTLLPPATPQGLSDDEQRLITGLSTKLSIQWPEMWIRDAYYNGEQRMQNLGIAVPSQLASIRTVVDWPRICIDPIVQRCVNDGFRSPAETDADVELSELWHANDLDAEAPLTYLDALVFGRGYMIVGAPDYTGGSPLITVESPANLAILWDPRTRRTTAAYQSYEVEGVFRAVLYLPDQTVAMSRTQSNGAWSVDNRDQHNFGQVPVVRFVNRARSANREGRSEISPAIMATTDSACRSLLGMEIAREFYAIPHRYVLGATETDFVDASGNPKTALDMAMNKFLALERDDAGLLPTVGQFTAFDPSVFTKIIDEHAQLMASFTQFPPQMFGQVTTANPASADAIRVADNGIERRAAQVTRQFSRPAVEVMQLAWRFANGGAELPAEMRNLTADWMDTAIETPAGTSESIFRQVQMGSVPPISDVVLQKLGWGEVQRQRLAQDRAVDAGASVLAQLASSLQAKEARADITVARDINPAAVKATVASDSTSSSGGSGNTGTASNADSTGH